MYLWKVIKIKEIEELAENFEYLDPVYRFFAVGSLYHAANNLDKAEEYYLKSLKEKDDFFLAKYNLAKAYVEGKKYNEAKNTLENITKTQPDSIEAFVFYGDVLMDLEKYEDAIDVYKKLLEREEIRKYSRRAYLYHNLALSLYKNGRIEESIDFFLQSLDSIDRSTNVLFSGILVNLAKTYFKAGMAEKAIEKLKWGIERDSTDPDFYAVLGAIYLEQGKMDCAREYLEKALKIDPYNSFALEKFREIEKSESDKNE